jgi:DNA-binding NarL/FixJ family response regulator
VTLRVLVADDERLVRAGYRMVLQPEPGVDVVGEAADGVEAVRLAAELRPDVVVMDVRMPGLDGIAATRRVVALDPAPAVLVVTTFDLDKYVFAALRAGACGFLLKDAPEEQLLAALRTAALGVSLLAPAVTRRLVARYARADEKHRAALATLTARETDVLVLLARGLSNAGIARELYVGEATVKTHLSHVLAKLGLVSRTQAVVFAYESGLVAAGSGG